MIVIGGWCVLMCYWGVLICCCGCSWIFGLCVFGIFMCVLMRLFGRCLVCVLVNMV